MIQPIRGIIVLTLGVSVFLVTGCFDGTKPAWEEERIGFDVGLNTTPAHSVSLDMDEVDAFVEEIQVNLAGAHQDHDVVAIFEINEEETTAVEGTHFNILNPNNAAVIPANSSFGYIEVEILAENFDPAEEVTLVTRLTDESDWQVMEQYREYTLTVGKDEVEFSADLEGEEGYEDVSGSIELQGDTPAGSFSADISLSGLEEQQAYSWAIYEGSCALEGDIIGEESDYPDMETGEEETSASAEAEVNESLDPHGEMHVRVFRGSVLFGDDLVVCQQIN